MTAQVLRGKEIAAHVLDQLSERARRLNDDGIRPCLTFVMIGTSPPAEVYAERLEKLGSRVGVQVARHQMRCNISAAELEQEVAALSAEPHTDGILVQMPLPDHLLPARLSAIMDPRKDVDGVTIHNAGQLYLGLPGRRPSTASAIMQILEWSGCPILGRHAVIVGRSNVVGHPVAELLLQQDATVTVTHRQTPDLGALTRQGDILVVAAGEVGLITPDMVKEGAVIVDAGINVTDHGVVGDVDYVGCSEVAGAITPVPGGVGPVTNACLLRSVVDSAEQRGG